MQEEKHNVYSLPSMTQSIKYLHAAAGFPVKETWLTAIEAGNYVTWPGQTTAAVRKHFPDSDETQKGHMKKQRQGVRSTRTKEKSKDDDELVTSPFRKSRDVYVKIQFQLQGCREQRQFQGCILKSHHQGCRTHQ
jgi:hypothetical protein